MATLEIMIAMVVLVMALTAVILVLFGGQSIAVDTQTNQEAIYMAQKELEVARALSRGTVAEFGSILPATSSEDIYSKGLEVSDISACAKKVTSNLDWTLENRPQTISLSSIFSSIEAFTEAGSICSTTPPPRDDLRNPSSNHPNVLINTVNGESIAVLNKIVYLGVYDSNDNMDDLFIYDASNTANPIPLGSLGIDWGPGNKLNGIVDLVAAYYPVTDKKYVFAAGVHGVYYDADDPGGGIPSEQASGQLQIVDVTNPLLPSQVASVSLPGVSGSCNSTCPGGRSIAFYNNRIYIGTHRVGGPEFHVFDVTDPTNPVHLGNTTSTQVDHNINDIEVRGTTAYLATSSDTEEVIALDVSNPGAISIDRTFDARKSNGSPSSKDGRALYPIGNRVYLGVERATAANDLDFYVLDEGDFSAALGAKNFNTNQGAGITGIRVSDNLAFVSTRDPNDPFHIWDVAVPGSIAQWDVCDINFSVDPQEIVYENGIVYSVTNQQSKLRIIESSPVCI
ncbi:MAG: hypothetical protein HY506_02210 [Candidatus Yanofskybacteria bacterium]|nr:hypothetical protein [Candidatus Yanofskybacteria bacterium]